jgi:lipase
VTIHTARLGRRDGLPAVLAHCFLGHSGVWARLLAALATPLDARAFDMPGHGRSSDWTGDGLFAEVAALIGAQVGDHPGDRALLVGHSFGGAASLRFAIENPTRCAGLVLIEPVFFAAAAAEPEYAPYLEAEHRLRAAFAEGDMTEAGRRFLALNGDADAWEALPAAQQAQLSRQMPLIAASVAAMHDDSDGLLAPGRPERLDRPVLLLDGAASPPIFGAVNRALARRLPRARRVTIPFAGHMLPITHAATVAAEIDTRIADEGLWPARATPQTRAG